MKKLAVSVFLAIGLVVPCAASTVLMTFDDVELPGATERDMMAYGFRISPRCHLHVGRYVSDLDGKQLTGDSSGCLDPCDDLAHPAYRNCSYAGTPGTAVRIDRPGDTFSLLSLRFNAFAGTSIRSSSGAEILLSSGVASQFLDVTLLPGFADWQRLDWLEISRLPGGVPDIFFDDLAFAVSAPSSIALCLLGLGVAALLRQRKVLPRGGV